MGIKRIFIDSNIFLNVLLEENEHCESSVKLLEDVENGKFIATTTLMNLMEILFVMRKHLAEIRDEELVETVEKIFEIENFIITLPNETHILEAYNLQRNSRIQLNDAIFVAVARNEADAIVTRDKKMWHAASSKILAVSPEEI